LAEKVIGLGHEILDPVPSLFTFHITDSWVRQLAGLAVASAEISVPGTSLRERGPVLFTHWGISGPAVLRLSAWGARDLHQCDYAFNLRVRWCGELSEEQVLKTFQEMRTGQPGKAVANTPLFQIPARLWERLVVLAGIFGEERWNRLSKSGALSLAAALLRTDLPVTGKSMHKDEFVTCGGVSLKQVDFKTMESRISPGLYFAGEVLDLDGITGGFNFQAAWTTGWLAGTAMAR
jgi:predicted Rossmann fold flavoprotein